MVTIHDVAREAGVSPATVSRAFNKNQSVGPEYVRRVKEAADRLGYRPNLVARNLRTSTSDVLTVIVPDIDNNFHTAVARGAEDVAQEAGYSVLLGNSDEDPQKEKRYIEASELHRVAGVLLCPHTRDVDISALTAHGVPVVAIDREIRADVDTVMASNSVGAYEATMHLHSEGWKRPACISGPFELETHMKRVDGYTSAMLELGLEPAISSGHYDPEGGYQAASSLMERDVPPDSFFVVNERVCIGVLRMLRERGLIMSRDVGVITFDDTPWAPLITPPMSVVEQPAYEIGAQAARMLIERLQGGANIPSRKVELATRLVVRESSRGPLSHSGNSS